MKVRERFGDAKFVIYLDGGCGALLRHFEGHYHAVVVARGEGTAAEQVAAEQPGTEGMACNEHIVLLYAGVHAQLPEHFHDGLGAVAFFSRKAADASKAGLPGAECGKDRNDREEIRRVGQINLEGIQRRLLDADCLGVLHLRDACACLC